MQRTRRAEAGRLLVVDDNKVNRLLLARSLETQGHRVELAENGRVALEMLRAETFDLLLLDMEMPELDGFGVLEQMRADGKLRDLPVIVTSSLEGVAHVVRCLDLGADDFLHKPVNPVLLKARINSSLEKKRLRDQQRALISRFATSEVAEDLQQSGFALGGRRLQCTVMFSDIRGFTALCDQLDPAITVTILNDYFQHMSQAIGRHHGHINELVGDGLLALFGALEPNPWQGRDSVLAALDMRAELQRYNRQLLARGLPELRFGIGIHTGEVVTGVMGAGELSKFSVTGDPINVASRVEGLTRVHDVDLLVTDEVRRSLDPHFLLQAMPATMVKGKPEPIATWYVSGMAGQSATPAELPALAQRQ